MIVEYVECLGCDEDGGATPMKLISQQRTLLLPLTGGNYERKLALLV